MNKQIIAGVALGAFVATGLGTVYTAAKAQTPNVQGQPGQQGGRPGFGGQGGPGGGFGGGQGGGMMRGMMGGGMQPVVTATERYVYVLRGDTLFQYSAEGLKLVAKATLPQDQRQGGPGGPGGPGGN